MKQSYFLPELILHNIFFTKQAQSLSQLDVFTIFYCQQDFLNLLPRWAVKTFTIDKGLTEKVCLAVSTANFFSTYVL